MLLKPRLHDKEAGWCRECNQFLARWCKKCNSEDELQSGLCSRCAGLVVPGSRQYSRPTLCSSTVDPRSFALCPRSDVARQTFELSKMVREDKARPLLVTEVHVSKISDETLCASV